jgi:hypothetical protein
MANPKRDYLLETRLDVRKFRDARLASFARVSGKGGEDGVYVGDDSVEPEKVAATVSLGESSCVYSTWSVGVKHSPPFSF